MTSIKSIMNIPANRILTLKVPDSIPVNEEVEVTIQLYKKAKEYDARIRELENVMNDKDFLEDLKGVNQDFELIDLEGFE